MVRTLLVRGMLAGLLAGILGFGVAKTLGEPQVDKAISFEGRIEQLHHEQPGEELVTRPLQNSGGLGTGAILYGVAIGGIFALVFAVAYGRLGPLTARGTAAVLALLGFISIYLVPLLKYPPNPPAIGIEDTIGRRTGLYLLMIAASVGAMVLAVVLRRRLVPRFGAWDSTLLVGAGYGVVIFLCYVLFPGINEVPQKAISGVTSSVTDAGVTFPPAVLWRFRIASLAIQATVWTTIAISFGYLAQKQLETDRVPQAGRENVGV